MRAGVVVACVAALALGAAGVWLLGRSGSEGEAAPEDLIARRGTTTPAPAPAKDPTVVPVPASEPPAAAAPAADSSLALIEQAEADLALLKTQLASHKTQNEDLIGSIGAVLAAYRSLASASGERVAEFRKNAEKALLDALTVDLVKPKATTNDREPVNVAAAEALAATGNRALSPKVIRAIESGLMKAKYDVTPKLWEAAFGALGRLGDPETLVWYQGEFVHTKNSPREVVDQLVAAHKSIPLFPLSEMSAKQRHDLAKAMITPYTSTESAAEQSRNDPKKQASKVFWDHIGMDAIKAVQYLAGEPVDPSGQAIATMRDLATWLRDHDDARKPPWKPAR